MKKLILLMLLSITTFAQVKVSTLSGKANNLEYTIELEKSQNEIYR